MGKMMPLKWIEQAEARKMCVMAASERMPGPRSTLTGTFLTGLLLRLRAWFVPSRDREGEEPTLDRVVRLRRVRRAAS